MLWCISKLFYFLSPWRMHKGIFPLKFIVSAWSNSRRQNWQKYASLPCLSLAFLISRTCSCLASNNLSITLPVFLPRHLVPIDFCLWVSVPVSCDSSYSSAYLTNLGGSGLPCDLTSLKDLRRVIDFSVCSCFYLLG